MVFAIWGIEHKWTVQNLAYLNEATMFMITT